MAVATKTNGKNAKIKPNGLYDVELNRAVKHGATWLRPNASRLRLSGQAVIELGDAVERSVLVK